MLDIQLTYGEMKLASIFSHILHDETASAMLLWPISPCLPFSFGWQGETFLHAAESIEFKLLVFMLLDDEEMIEYRILRHYAKR